MSFIHLVKLSTAHGMLTLNGSVHENCWIETALCQLVQLCTNQAAMAQCSHKDSLQKCHEETRSSSPPSSIHRPEPENLYSNLTLVKGTSKSKKGFNCCIDFCKLQSL